MISKQFTKVCQCALWIINSLKLSDAAVFFAVHYSPGQTRQTPHSCCLPALLSLTDYASNIHGHSFSSVLFKAMRILNPKPSVLKWAPQEQRDLKSFDWDYVVIFVGTDGVG